VLGGGGIRAGVVCGVGGGAPAATKIIHVVVHVF